MASAVQFVLQNDLSTSRTLIPVPVNNSSAAYSVNGNEVLRATITERAGQTAIEATVTENKTQRDVRVIDVEGPATQGILPLLNQLAKQLDPNASPFSAKNTQALRAYIKAAGSTNTQERISALTDAVSIDPAFGLAYIVLIDTEAQAAPQALPAVLQIANSHKTGFTPLDRARFNALLARVSHASLKQQESAFRAVLQIAPDDSDALVAVGSLSFLRGDAATGTGFLDRALQLNPGNLSVRHTLATGLFETRRFPEAEKILVGIDNDPNVLPELALCVFLEGDLSRANTIADRLFASIQNPDVKVLYRAVWLKLTGQNDKAVQLLNTAALEQPAARAVAYSELAMWQMLANDFAGAKQWAAKARQLDPGPGSVAGTIELLTAANGPADQWEQEVNSALGTANSQVKNTVLGYGFFLGGHYAKAVQTWQQILQQAGDTDLRVRAMLAASLVKAGKPDEARQLNVEPFVPDLADLYATVSFLEMNRYLGIGVR